MAEKFRNLESEAEITVYEREAHIGGRVGSFLLDGELNEKGGTGLVDSGKAYFKQFVDKFGLKVHLLAIG